MTKNKLKLTLAGALAACALGGMALSVAWATPGAGVISAVLSGAELLDEIELKGETDTHEIEIRASGAWEMHVVHFEFEPGGHTGWHSHPGPAFVMVNAGTLTLYYADNPDVGVDYPAGTGWVEEPGRVHIARNHGPDEVELDAFLLTPLDAPLRIDEPAPPNE